ncbi:MAG: hypothetical protein ACYDA2_07690 [Acidimicrobiales bacterium]
MTEEQVATPRLGCLGVVRRAALLLGQALASDDAEAGGLHADDVLADSGRAESLLGGPEGWPAARHAVVQRYGRVGALLVVGFEERWRRRNRAGAHEVPCPPLEHLLDRFPSLGAEEIDVLLREVDRSEGEPTDGETLAARRWLHATYAVAARDGSDTTHRAYMCALDRVMRQARPILAS